MHKLKNFDEYLKTRLSKEELAEIKQQAQCEKEILERRLCKIRQVKIHP